MHPEAYGLTNLRPNAAFAYSFPFPAESLARLAYYFEYDYADGRRVEDYMGPLLEQIATWRELAGTVMLRLFDRSDGVLLIHDTRPGAAAFQQRLTGLERAVYLYCDTGRTLAKIVEHAAQFNPESPPPEAALRRMLANWVDERLMVHLDDRYLSLALRAPAESRSALSAGQTAASSP
jgi:hypothetical protein